MLIVLAVGVGEFLAPQLQQAAKQQKAFSKFSDVTFGGGGRRVGARWQPHPQRRAAVGRAAVRRHDDFRAVGGSSAAGDRACGARDCGLRTMSWLLRGYPESRFDAGSGARPARAGERRLESSVSAEFLGLAVDDPHDMEIATLWRLIRLLPGECAGCAAVSSSRSGRGSRAPWRLRSPCCCRFRSCWARCARRARGRARRWDLLLGIGFFLLQRLIESGTLVFDLNPIILAWMPTALLAPSSHDVARARSLTFLAAIYIGCFSTLITRGSMYDFRPMSAYTRPMPDSLAPPNGTLAAVARCWFTHAVPTSSLRGDGRGTLRIAAPH